MMPNSISVAIATYNGEKYIARQLTSIVEQTLKPDEIVVCDDNSNDKTVEIVNSFAKRFETISWRIFVNRENLGYKNNFAKAILEAEGDIIFLSDQDDCWLPHKIETMVYAMNSDLNIKVLASKYIKVEGDDLPAIKLQKYDFKKNHFDLYTKKYLKKIQFKKSFYMTHSPGCSLALRKECKQWFMDEQWDGNEPHDEFLLMIGQLENAVYFLDQYLFFYIRHEGATTYGKMKNRKERINHLEKKYDSLLMSLKYLDARSDIDSKSKKSKIITKEISFLRKRIVFLEKPSFLGGLALLVSFYKYEKISYLFADLYFSTKQ